MPTNVGLLSLSVIIISSLPIFQLSFLIVYNLDFIGNSLAAAAGSKFFDLIFFCFWIPVVSRTPFEIEVIGNKKYQ